MNVILLELGIIAVLLMVNALFSMSEMAVVSSRKSRLHQLANEGNKGAVEALRLAEAPNRFLSTIQIGITLVGVLSGAFGGATLSEEIGDHLVGLFPLSAEVAEGIGVGIVVTGITFLSVILGELVPKRLALKFPERIASLAAAPMSAIARFSSPVVWLFSIATDMILRLFRLDKPSGESGITHEEIKAMVEQGAQEGGIDESERRMMDRVLSFGKKRITSIMTPAREIVWIDALKPLEPQLRRVLKSHYSHYPVAEGSLDHLLGTLPAKDFCLHLKDGERDLSAHIFQPIYIPETSNAMHALEVFKKTGLQMGFVIDEFGAIQGILTITNILEAIVGDIPHQSVSSDDLPVQRREDGSWLVDGGLPIEELKENLGISYMDGEEEHLFQTVAGFVMHRLGRVPKAADVLVWQDWKFEVVDMDRNRIDKILVSKKDTLSATLLLGANEERSKVRRDSSVQDGRIVVRPSQEAHLSI